MTMLSTPDQIHQARLLTLRAAVRLEALGMTRRGRSATAIAREAMGLSKRAPRQWVLAALDEAISARYTLEA